MKYLPLLIAPLMLASCPRPGDPETPGYDCAAKPSLKGVVSVSQAIAGKYIVVLKDKPPQGLVQTYAVGVSEVQTFDGGYAAKIARTALRRVLADPNVAYVQEDGLKSIGPRVAVHPQAAVWGLDRIDQRDLPLDGAYVPGYSGTNVHAFVIDTGVDTNHSEFTGRSGEGYSVFPGQPTDGHGHGTHVAGIIVGTTYGVAKNGFVHAVKVLDDQGSGADSGVIRGVNWVKNWKIANPDALVVANMSLGGGKSPALDQSVCDAIAAGVTMVLAGGNEGQPAENYSPSRVRQAIVAGATDRNDRVATWSNHGVLLDLHAPGVDILSARTGGGTETMSGTSMASPHVAGAAALILERFPDADPQEVRDRLILRATTGKLNGFMEGSPDLLLYTRQDEEPWGSETPKVTFLWTKEER